MSFGGSFQDDAAFSLPDMHKFPERDINKSAIPLTENAVVRSDIAHLPKRPVSYPQNHVQDFHARFRYRTGLRSRKRYVVGNGEWRSDELYLRTNCIVANLIRSAAQVVAFYNQRGAAERWITKDNEAVQGIRLSYLSRKANTAYLQLHAFVCRLANLPRASALTDQIESWPLTTLLEKAVESDAKVIVHARYRTAQKGAVTVPHNFVRRAMEVIGSRRPLPYGYLPTVAQKRALAIPADRRSVATVMPNGPKSGSAIRSGRESGGSSAGSSAALGDLASQSTPGPLFHLGFEVGKSLV